MAKTSQHTVWHYRRQSESRAVSDGRNNWDSVIPDHFADQGRIVEGHIALNGMVRYDAIRMDRHRWELNE